MHRFTILALSLTLAGCGTALLNGDPSLGDFHTDFQEDDIASDVLGQIGQAERHFQSATSGADRPCHVTRRSGEVPVEIDWKTGEPGPVSGVQPDLQYMLLEVGVRHLQRGYDSTNIINRTSEDNVRLYSRPLDVPREMNAFMVQRCHDTAGNIIGLNAYGKDYTSTPVRARDQIMASGGAWEWEADHLAPNFVSPYDLSIEWSAVEPEVGGDVALPVWWESDSVGVVEKTDLEYFFENRCVPYSLSYTAKSDVVSDMTSGGITMGSDGTVRVAVTGSPNARIVTEHTMRYEPTKFYMEWNWDVDRTSGCSPTEDDVEDAQDGDEGGTGYTDGDEEPPPMFDDCDDDLSPTTVLEVPQAYKDPSCQPGTATAQVFPWAWNYPGRGNSFHVDDSNIPRGASIERVRVTNMGSFSSLSFTDPTTLIDNGERVAFTADLSRSWINVSQHEYEGMLIDESGAAGAAVWGGQQDLSLPPRPASVEVEYSCPATEADSLMPTEDSASEAWSLAIDHPMLSTTVLVMLDDNAMYMSDEYVADGRLAIMTRTTAPMSRPAYLNDDGTWSSDARACLSTTDNMECEEWITFSLTVDPIDRTATFTTGPFEFSGELQPFSL